MTDLEGLTLRLLEGGLNREAVVAELCRQLSLFKPHVDAARRRQMADAIFEETSRSLKSPRNDPLNELLQPSEAKASMGEAGVGSRGWGDLFVHRLLTAIATRNSESVPLQPASLDDAGAVNCEGRIVVVAVDGTHSRLSRFPLIAGFHVARAALRDVLVKGATPVALFDDLHLADDGDVGRLFDFVAGVSAVGELAGVPLVAGSTLRLGGDMVVGDRMVSCVGAVGILESVDALKPRRAVKPGDVILMTEGSGGGTIATTAIYSGKPDLVLETLNVNSLRACQSLMGSEAIRRVHCMTDVTNGGVRGDAYSICQEAGVGLVFEYEKFIGLINPAVLGMLEELSIDPLGLSIDSLLIFTPEHDAEHVMAAVRAAGVRVAPVGHVVGEPRRAVLVRGGRRESLEPKFRESPYTEVKKAVGEDPPSDERGLNSGVYSAFKAALAKKEKLVGLVGGKPPR